MAVLLPPTLERLHSVDLWRRRFPSMGKSPNLERYRSYIVATSDSSRLWISASRVGSNIELSLSLLEGVAAAFAKAPPPAGGKGAGQRTRNGRSDVPWGVWSFPHAQEGTPSVKDSILEPSTGGRCLRFASAVGPLGSWQRHCPTSDGESTPLHEASADHQ